MKVTFISANDGKIELYNSVDTLITACSTVEDLVTVIRTWNLDFSGAYGSSSLDFSSEYGFPTDSAAYEMLTTALEIA